MFCSRLIYDRFQIYRQEIDKDIGCYAKLSYNALRLPNYSQKQRRKENDKRR